MDSRSGDLFPGNPLARFARAFCIVSSVNVLDSSKPGLWVYFIEHAVMVNGAGWLGLSGEIQRRFNINFNVLFPNDTCLRTHFVEGAIVIDRSTFHGSCN